MALVFMFASLPTAQVIKLDPWCELKTMPERTAPLWGLALTHLGGRAAHPGSSRGSPRPPRWEGAVPALATAPVGPPGVSRCGSKPEGLLSWS